MNYMYICCPVLSLCTSLQKSDHILYRNWIQFSTHHANVRDQVWPGVGLFTTIDWASGKLSLDRNYINRFLSFLSWGPTTPPWACCATPCGGFRLSDSFLRGSERMDHGEGASTGFMVASGGVLGYGHDGHGVCLGDSQTEAYLKDTGMTGLASAWAMARQRPI